MGHPFGARARLRGILVRRALLLIGKTSAASAPDCALFWYVPYCGEGELSGPGGRRLYLLIGNFCRLFKNSHKHRAGQFSGLGVLVRGMVRGQ